MLAGFVTRHSGNGDWSNCGNSWTGCSDCVRDRRNYYQCVVIIMHHSLQKERREDRGEQEKHILRWMGVSQ